MRLRDLGPGFWLPFLIGLFSGLLSFTALALLGAILVRWPL